MKAIVCTRSGTPDVLQLREVEKPVPKENEILVKVHAATVTIGDVLMRKIPRFILFPMGVIFGFKAMKIPGVEFAGEVEGVGSKVKLFKKGEEVFGTTAGLKFGGNAEYVCLPEKRKLGVVANKPGSISFEEAAAVSVGGMTAIQILRKANIQKGQKVLIYGASGSVGTNAVQLARYYGAEVTGVCSTNNMELVKSLGAESVVDYTEEDFTKSELTYDVIFDTVGKISKSLCKNSLKKNGHYLSVKSVTHEKVEDLVFLGNLLEEGKIKSVIDKHYSLEEVAKAHRYVEKGHKKGNVIITLEHNNI